MGKDLSTDGPSAPLLASHQGEHGSEVAVRPVEDGFDPDNTAPTFPGRPPPVTAAGNVVGYPVQEIITREPAPTQSQIMAYTAVHDHPAHVSCPNCGHTGLTKIHKVSGFCTCERSGPAPLLSL
ncbi:hypothetical protein WJX73_003989 [Symbiochloris irregularis]|uniref:Uncharacterized protein n=1 Tax=Symbiochloris irregularis TaxID=706552 RepID=A0AAW1PKF1_9CHLO